MKVVSVVNRKGGVGKTATVQNLAAYLQKRGKKVLVIDLDSQTNLTFSYGAEPSDIMEILEGEKDAAENIQHTACGDIIPASANLSNAEKILDGTGREYKLKEALEDITGYDYVLIDTPAALGVLTINALTVSDSVIIPVQADYYSLQGLSQIKEVITNVQKYTNPDLKVDGILLTRYNRIASLSKAIKEALENNKTMFDTTVFKTPIRECITIKETSGVQKSVFEYAPKSNAALDYANFGDEFIERTK